MYDAKIIEECDWSRFVSEHYNRPYRFQQQNGCQDKGIFYLNVPVEDPYDEYPDTVPEIVNHNEMGVNFQAWLSRDPQQFLTQNEKFPELKAHSRDLWWERNFYPPIESIANDLHTKGLLPAGEYVINIDW